MKAGVSAKGSSVRQDRSEAKRKMGHINLLTNDVEKALTWMERQGFAKVSK